METEELPTRTPAPADMETIHRVANQIVWLRSTNQYGHTGIKLESGGKAIYLDPVDLVGIDDLPKADWILITHDHRDHFSIKTIAALTTADTIAVSIKTLQYSMGGAKFFALAPGETVDAGGLEVIGVPSYNDNHPKAMGYLGFIITIEGVRIYFSGDSGMTPELELLSGIDIAVLNVLKPYTFSGEEAVQFAKTVKPKILIPIHWIPGGEIGGDPAEIEYIRENMPAETELKILDLWPPAA